MIDFDFDTKGFCVEHKQTELVKLSKTMSIRQQAIATAHVYIRRYYIKVELRRTNPYLVMATALYLACKMEECPLHIRVMVSEARNIWPGMCLSFSPSTIKTSIPTLLLLSTLRLFPSTIKNRLHNLGRIQTRRNRIQPHLRNKLPPNHSSPLPYPHPPLRTIIHGDRRSIVGNKHNKRPLPHRPPPPIPATHHCHYSHFPKFKSHPHSRWRHGD